MASDVGSRYYFVDGGELVNIGAHATKALPQYAGRTMNVFSYIFARRDNTILELRVESLLIDADGKIDSDHYWKEMYSAPTLMDDESGMKGIDIKARRMKKRAIESITSAQKEMIKERVNRNLKSPNAWEQISPKMKADFMTNGLGRAFSPTSHSTCGQIRKREPSLPGISSPARRTFSGR